MTLLADPKYRRAVIGGVRECAKRIERTLTDARLAFDLSRRLEPRA